MFRPPDDSRISLDVLRADRLDICQKQLARKILILIKTTERDHPIVKTSFSREAAMEYFHQTVREIMSRPARTVAPEMTLGDLLRLFSSNDFDAYPVLREDELVGIVSRADLIKPFAAKVASNALDCDAIMGTTVEQIMSPRVVTVELDATVDQVIELMSAHHFESFPAVDDENRVKGIVARDDVVRTLAESTWRSSLPLELRPFGYAIA
jgi:CBS domain-containing protein